MYKETIQANGNPQNEIMKDLERLLNTQLSSDKEILTIDEACRFMHLSRTLLYTLRKSGALPFQLLGTRVYIKRQDLIGSLKEGKFKT